MYVEGVGTEESKEYQKHKCYQRKVRLLDVLQVQGHVPQNSTMYKGIHRTGIPFPETRNNKSGSNEQLPKQGQLWKPWLRR